MQPFLNSESQSGNQSLYPTSSPSTEMTRTRWMVAHGCSSHTWLWLLTWDPGVTVEGRPFASSCLIFSHSRFNASLNLFFPGRLELVLLFFSWKDESGLLWAFCFILLVEALVFKHGNLLPSKLFVLTSFILWLMATLIWISQVAWMTFLSTVFTYFHGKQSVDRIVGYLGPS